MSGRPSVSPRYAEAITPAAGPDSTMNTGRTLAASEPKMPPLDCITRSFACDARGGEPALDPLQVALDDGADHGVDHRRRRPQVLAELRRDLRRERDRDPGQLLREDRADPLLVLRVDVGVEEADGHRLDAFPPQDRPQLRARSRPRAAAAPRPSGRAARRRRPRGRAGRAASPSRTACRRASAAPGARSRAGRGSRRS